MAFDTIIYNTVIKIKKKIEDNINENYKIIITTINQMIKYFSEMLTSLDKKIDKALKILSPNEWHKLRSSDKKVQYGTVAFNNFGQLVIYDRRAPKPKDQYFNKVSKVNIEKDSSNKKYLHITFEKTLDENYDFDFDFVSIIRGGQLVSIYPLKLINVVKNSEKKITGIKVSIYDVNLGDIIDISKYPQTQELIQSGDELWIGGFWLVVDAITDVDYHFLNKNF